MPPDPTEPHRLEGTRAPAIRLLEPLREMAAESMISARVSGDCMQPLLTDGARIEIRPRRLYLPGDLLAFAHGGRAFFVHRFLGYAWKGRVLLVTQADSASRRDRPVDPRQVLGRVCGGEVPRRAVVIPLADRLRAVSLWAKWGLCHLFRSRP